MPHPEDEVAQECGAGLVRVRRGERLGFAAPPVVLEGPVSADERAHLLRALALTEADVVDARWIDNGAGWVGVLLRDAAAVLHVRPDWAEFGDLEVGVAGPYPAGSECAVRCGPSARASASWRTPSPAGSTPASGHGSPAADSRRRTSPRGVRRWVAVGGVRRARRRHRLGRRRCRNLDQGRGRARGLTSIHARDRRGAVPAAGPARGAHAGATEHLRGIIHGDRTLSARQVAALLTGMKVISAATVTAQGEPRISAMDGHFLHGTWTFSTSRSAATARHLAARPAVSVAHVDHEEFAVFSRGHAVEVTDPTDVAEVDARWTATTAARRTPGASPATP